MKSLFSSPFMSLIILLCSSCAKIETKSSTIKAKNICHTPKLGQLVTLDIESGIHSGEVTSISPYEIVVSSSNGLTAFSIPQSQNHKIYC
ncbi:MAG: hypothetical protein RLZZ223_190 [Candidatus Parcubacteria bacterium]